MGLTEQQTRELDKVLPRFLDGVSLLRQLVEQSIEERKMLTEAAKAFLKQVRADMDRTREFLVEFQQFKKEYEKVTAEVLEAVESLKNLQELREINKRLAEALTG